jgi:hypothetical protein
MRGRIDAYEPWRKSAVATATAYLEAGIEPAAVARSIARVLERRSPRLRYRVGPDVTRSFWFRRFSPESLFQWMVARYYGLHRPAR